jgi:hypothetical protein
LSRENYKNAQHWITFTIRKKFPMCSINSKKIILSIAITVMGFSLLTAQSNLNTKFTKSSVYAGIEVGAKGVKMSILEIGKNAQTSGAFNVLKDTSVNTDFISFSPASFQKTLDGFYNLYMTASKEYNIPVKKIFTVISSGVKMQAEKEKKTAEITKLISAFKTKINEANRKVEVIDVLQEARLSHLGIVPNERRYNTFLIDIGSGNAKGGYFPYDNINNFKLFQLNRGTKSTANDAEKKCDELDKSLKNYQRQLQKILATAENTEIIYAVNASGTYDKSDYIAFSGGIAWSVATLMHPEMVDNSVISVNFNEVIKFSEKLYNNYYSLSDSAIAKNLQATNPDKAAIVKSVKTVNGVFDQRSLMAGTGLLLKIMRQFVSATETKQFYLIKNGQVGWISAYVDQEVD